MKLVFLGTASCFPTPSRGVSCTALQLDDGQVWLFDCGEGSQIQLQRSSIKPGKITKIFITHLHGDHLYGLPGLLCTLANGTDPKKIGDTTIELYGPVGIRNFITTSLGISRSPLAFKLSVIEMVPCASQYPEDWKEWKVQHELQDESYKLPQESNYRRVEISDKSWKLFSDKDFSVEAGILVHRIPSFGFVIKESTRPGQLDSRKLQEIGLKPGPLYGKLQKGQTVSWEGQTLDPTDFLGPARPGREVVILGDTANSDHLLDFMTGPDVICHEATMENKMVEQCVSFGHSTPDMAVGFAQKCRADKLVIFHLSPRYQPISASPTDSQSVPNSDSPKHLKTDDVSVKETAKATAQIILDEALAAKEQLGLENLDVVVAQDFTEVEIPRRKV